MISAWWIIPAVMVGAIIGMVLTALVAANDKPKKWWDE